MDLDGEFDKFSSNSPVRADDSFNASARGYTIDFAALLIAQKLHHKETLAMEQGGVEKKL
jgi:hypothetical protein